MSTRLPTPAAQILARIAVVLVVVTTALTGATSEPPPAGTSGVMRRLTEAQYRNAIADIFGADIEFGGRMDPVVRPPHGLQVAGVSQISVSAAGFEQYARMAQAIAGQVVNERHRSSLVGCRPRALEAPDDACAAAFFRRIGRLLFRRPLSDADVQAHVGAAREGTRVTKHFYTGLALALEPMLVSARFLFDMDVTEPDPAKPGTRRLDGYSKASRLAFFLWGTTPDLGLLDAAARGALHTETGLAAQVNRLLTSPRIEVMTRAFFSDMLGLERLADLSKDPVIYPQFVQAVRADMSEQTLRTIVQILGTENGDYRDIFTTRRTFMTRALAAVYRVPVAHTKGWAPYEFPEGSPRAGVLTQITFLAAYAHPGRSSATLRGKALRELLLCQPIPDPPANVNFSLVEDTKNPERRTARDRLTVHRNSRACANCHKLMDPIGLSLENFDGAGVYRTDENGASIDASGELDGVAFKDPRTLGEAVRNHPGIPACLVRGVSEYAVRRPLTEEDTAWVKDLRTRFIAGQYRWRQLLRIVATSKAFYKSSVDNHALRGEVSK